MRRGGCEIRTCCDKVSATVNAPLDLFVQYSNVKEHRALVKGADDFHRHLSGWHDGAKVSRDYAEKKGQVIGLDVWAGSSAPRYSVR
jgi:hypothetical protein